MGKGLYPDEYLESAYTVDYERLYAEGFRGIVYDIDNTLVLPDAPADERSTALVKRLKEIGYKVMVLSNNREPRVKSFAEAIGAQYIAKGGKPLLKGYLRSMELLGTGTGDTLFIGDQIFTDVWGANRAGMTTLLTKPFTDKEEIQIVLKRIIEKPVLWAYKNYDKKRRKKGNYREYGRQN